MKILASLLLLVISSVAFAVGGGHHESGHIPMGFVISQVVNVGILIGLIWYFAGASIRQFFKSQKEDYLKGMEAASQAVSIAEARKKEIEQRLQKLRAEADKDVETATLKAKEDYRIQLANAKNDALKIEQETQVALEAETQKAIEALRVETFQKSANYAESKMGKGLTESQQRAWNKTFPNRVRGGVH